MSASTTPADKPSADGLNRNYSWYEPSLTQIQEPARTILEKYSHLPEGEIIEHVKQVRDSAFAVFPYPCIGSFRFLDITICKSPAYPEILSRLKDSDTFLDLGCAMGQDIRHLVFEGVTQERIFGSDLHPEFIELGYDLFRDRSSLQCPFITSDIFDSNCELLQKLAGKLDIVNASSFFHLFHWDRQVALSKHIIKLLKPKPGSLIVGRHVGDWNAGDKSGGELGHGFYRHNLDSWRKMWDQISEETGTKWEVDVIAENWAAVQKNAHNDETAFKMQFVVRRG
ncbi:methyltransferase domain-containing protein [Aspergillus ellipticus CBS 707.79]|uniref:Methyltransferase domain-containing protein n=1 Tax=Aspergillus ellipticus CBS 707.79 TaxID=1448320 RepID=A0A319DE79_9EURO|nr:methyltransferase domain-containing protein [Aspergillus ellipticus CBS 707.79]